MELIYLWVEEYKNIQREKLKYKSMRINIIKNKTIDSILKKYININKKEIIMQKNKNEIIIYYAL